MILELVAGLLGGGLIATGISVWGQFRMARRQAELRHLDDALRHVYGPVLHLLTLMQAFLGHSRDVLQKGTEAFNKPWADSARESVTRQMTATIGAANKFVPKVIDAMDQIISIGKVAGHLVDLDDMEVFNEICLHRERLRVEYHDPDSKQIPLQVLEKLGAPFVYKEDWYARIEASYRRKLDRYKALAGMGRA